MEIYGNLWESWNGPPSAERFILAGGAISILKNMSSSMGKMKKPISEMENFKTMKPPSSLIVFDEYEWNMKMENDIPLIFPGNMSYSHEIPIRSGDLDDLILGHLKHRFTAARQHNRSEVVPICPLNG